MDNVIFQFEIIWQPWAFGIGFVVIAVISWYECKYAPDNWGGPG